VVMAEEDRVRRLESAIDNALVQLQTLALTDQLRPHSTAIGGVAKILVDALREGETTHG
jgi:hypothetical protein